MEIVQITTRSTTKAKAERAVQELVGPDVQILHRRAGESVFPNILQISVVSVESARLDSDNLELALKAAVSPSKFDLI